MTVGQPFNPFGLFTGIFIPDALMRCKLLSPGAKLCYGRLCRYAGQNGECFPHQDTLADELAVSSRTVRTYLAELIDNGFISIHQRGLNRTNVYVFLWHSVLDTTPLKTPPPQPVVTTGPEENFHTGPEENFQSRPAESFRSYKGRREVVKRDKYPGQIAQPAAPARNPNPLSFDEKNKVKPATPEDVEQFALLLKAEPAPITVNPNHCIWCSGQGQYEIRSEMVQCGKCRGSGKKTKTA